MTSKQIFKDISIGLLGGLTTAWLDQNIISLIVGEGPSMKPTFLPNSILLVKKFGFKDNLKKGDIVLTKTTYDDQTIVAKRISGLPGEEIKINDHKNMRLSKNYYYLLGDNLDQSFDSRHYGPIPVQIMQGKVIGILYPKFTFF